MNTAVVVFPGSNCEHDVVHALRGLGAKAELVWHRETDLSDFDGVILPGGFAHGDYLRTGAIARFSPVMEEVTRMANEGAPIVGICNGFQVLCEAGLLPGVLLENQDLKFICRPIHLRVEHSNSVLTRAASEGQVLKIPLNSYEGNYKASDEDFKAIVTNHQIIFRYAEASGEISGLSNPNGSMGAAAGIMNKAGNVAGLMPHPERATDQILGSVDGQVILESFIVSMETTDV